MEETFAYLKEVLGVKYVPLNYAAVIDSPETMENVEEAVQIAAQVPAEVEVDLEEDASLGQTIQAPDPEAAPAPNAPILAPTVPFDETTLEALQKSVFGCTRCKLAKGRRNIVFGQGASDADLMFVGEGPGDDDDRAGQPFVGPAGGLLVKMIAAMGLRREDVYVTNVVKCRPPMNRDPEPDEIFECAPLLTAQIKLVNPKVVVALGTFAAQTLLKSTDRIGQLRGRVHHSMGRKIIPTFHPSYLLKNPAEKKSTWEDLKLAMSELGLLAQSPGTKK